MIGTRAALALILCTGCHSLIEQTIVKEGHARFVPYSQTLVFSEPADGGFQISTLRATEAHAPLTERVTFAATAEVSTVATSLNLRWAVVSTERTVSVVDLENDAVTFTTTLPSSATAAISNDGQWLAYGSGGDTILQSLTAIEPPVILPAPNEQVGHVENVHFAPDSRSVISSFAKGHGSELVLGADGWKRTVELPGTGWHRWTSKGLVYLSATALHLRPEGMVAITAPFPSVVVEANRDKPCAFRTGAADNENTAVLQTSGERFVLLQCHSGGLWYAVFDLAARQWVESKQTSQISYEAKLALDPEQPKLLSFLNGDVRQIDVRSGEDQVLIGLGKQKDFSANLFMSGGATRSRYTVHLSPDARSFLLHDLQERTWTRYSWPSGQ